MSNVYLGLGSNKDHPTRKISQALKHLEQHPSLELIDCAPPYQSTPVGPVAQDDFVNTVALITTELSPLQLLRACQAIEQAMGRPAQRIHWGPRVIDLDILLFDDLVFSHPNLQIPHPHMTQRHFVLAPLHDLSPALQLPGGQSVADCLTRCTDQPIKLIQSKPVTPFTVPL